VDYRLDGNEWTQKTLSATGSFTLATSSTLSPGVHSVVIGYLGSGSYNAANSNTLTFTVETATPTLTWATPAAITAGVALSTTQLNATASVPGTFVYNPAAGTVLAAGNQTLSVTFTPTDTTDYVSTSSTVLLTVNAVVEPSYTIAANLTSVTGSSSVTLTLNSDNYTGTVSFATNVTLSNGTTATVTASAPPVQLTSGQAATTVLTITVVTTKAAEHTPTLPWKSGGALVFGAMLLGAPFAQRRKRLLAVLLTAAAISLVGFAMSCSGNDKNTTGPICTVTVTPSGTGTVTNPTPIAVSVSVP
jgi:hypothetical protein